MAPTFQYTGMEVWTRPANGTLTWTQRGDIDPTVPITLILAEEKTTESFDKDGVTVHVVKYLGLKGSLDGRFKAFDGDDIDVLLHSCTTSGDLHEFGKNKPVGVTASGFAIALKPVNDSDTGGVYIPQAVNLANFANVYSNQDGQYERVDFAFVLVRRDGIVSTPLCQIADSSATTLLSSFPS